VRAPREAGVDGEDGTRYPEGQGPEDGEMGDDGDEEGEEEDAMAAMLGFGGFGTTKVSLLSPVTDGGGGGDLKNPKGSPKGSREVC
jgi:hypothetical protein